MTIEELKKRNLILFEAVVGSKAYGLATADSDTDVKGVFYMPKDHFFGTKHCNQVNDESNNQVYYELGRFVELLKKSNPNMLELLASADDCILFKNKLMDVFNVDDMISKETVRTFKEYAMVQIRKSKGLNKKINNPIDGLRKDLLDFCQILHGNDSMPLKRWLLDNDIMQEECGLAKINHTKGLFALFHSSGKQRIYKGILARSDSQEVSCSPIPKGQTVKAYLFVNHEAYSMYCKSYAAYIEWTQNRNDARFSNTLTHGQGYDAKNMMHTMRLLDVSKEILETGKLQVKRLNRDFLLEVKSGKYTYAALSADAEKLIDEIDGLLCQSTLRDEPNTEKLEALLVCIRKQLYNR